MGEVVSDQVELCMGEEYYLTKALPVFVLCQQSGFWTIHLCNLPPDFLQSQSLLTMMYLGYLRDIGVDIRFIDLCKGPYNIRFQIRDLPIFLSGIEFQDRLRQFGLPSGYEIFILFMNKTSLNFLGKC